MKHIKKFNENKKSFGLHSLTDEELEERLSYLRQEIEYIQSDILDIVNLIKNRKNSKDENYVKTLPESIFDFNKEQLEWVFEHNHATTTEKYNLSNKYFNEFEGVMATGFNKNTNQFYFNIVSRRLMDDDEENYEHKPEAIKTVEFLAKNLKKSNDYVEFGVLYTYSDNYNDKVLISDEQIKYGSRYYMSKVKSVEKLLEYIVDNDLSSKDDN